MRNNHNTEGRLKDKVAVVTGSSRGIGREIAIVFAREGAKVVINYLKNKEAAQEVKAIISSDGGTSVIIQADVALRPEIKELFKDTFNQYGKIDILVNNAGINHRCFFEEITDEDWDLLMDVNLKGPFICSQEIFPYMIKQKSGRIINISSVAGQYHGPKTVHYAVSKAGLNSLTKVLSRYGAEHNILVNAVAPGLILTDQTKDELLSAAGEDIINRTLLKRPGNMNDVAAACLLLASDEQNYITGQVISVSGGAYLG